MMKRIYLVALFSAILCEFVLASDLVKKELMKLEQEWNDAYNRHDTDAVERILADDYVLIDADAYVVDKRAYLANIPRVQVKSETFTEWNIRVLGDTAIVTSVWNGTYTFDGEESTDTIRYTDVFVKRKGRWQAVTSQGTRVPKR